MPVPEEECACALCGKNKPCILHVRHERIDYVPASLVRHIEVREVRACVDCRKDVVTAPRVVPSASRRRIGVSVYRGERRAIASDRDPGGRAKG